MITFNWIFNLSAGLLLALVATVAMVEAKSSSLVPKSLLLWPVLLVLFGVLNLAVGGVEEFLFRGLLGSVLILCGIQAALVNIRKLSPWPSGLIWLGLVLAGIGFQFYSLFLERVMGFVWMAVGMTKLFRERSASLEAGTPFWISLLYLEAIFLAAYRI